MGRHPYRACVLLAILPLIVTTLESPVTSMPTCAGCDTEQIVTNLDPATMREHRTLSIKLTLLSKLGLQEPPEVPEGFPREMLMETMRRFMEQNDTEEQEGTREEYVKTSTILSMAVPGPQVNNLTLLEFNQNRDVESLQVTEATLYLHVHRIENYSRDVENNSVNNTSSINNSTSPKTKFWVFRKLSTAAGDLDVQELLGSIDVTGQPSGWKTLTVTSAISRWFAQPGQPLRLMIDCSGCSGLYEAVLFNNVKSKGANKPGSRQSSLIDAPVIEILTTPSPTRRMARRDIRCDKNTEHCCKQDFYVSFKDLGWSNWILAPGGYSANYCRGSCRSIHQAPDSFQSPNAFLVEEMKRLLGSNAITRCCAPTKLAPLSLVYVDAQYNIIKIDIPNMVVEECGCV